METHSESSSSSSMPILPVMNIRCLHYEIKTSAYVLRHPCCIRGNSVGAETLGISEQGSVITSSGKNREFWGRESDVQTYSITMTPSGQPKTITVTRWFHTLSLYSDIVYNMNGHLGNEISVSVTRWLYSVSL